MRVCAREREREREREGVRDRDFSNDHILDKIGFEVEVLGFKV